MMAASTITFKVRIKPWAMVPLFVVCAVNKYFRLRLPCGWAFEAERIFRTDAEKGPA